jgi:predicted transcriptional regulator
MARDMVGIRMDPALKALVQQLADEEDRTFSWMAERLISEALIARGRLSEDEKPRSSSSALRGRRAGE